MLSKFCLSVLSCLPATLVYCGQTVGCIKMKLGMQVGLGPGHIVLDGAQLSPLERGTAAPSLRTMFIVAKGSPISATAELLLYNRKINVNFEEKIKTTYKEVTKFQLVVKNLKSELKKINYDAVEMSSKNLSQSKKFDAIDIRL